MDEKKKGKRRNPAPGAAKVKVVLHLSPEAADILKGVMEKYPRIASKGDEVDAAIKWWGRYALHCGLDADLTPMMKKEDNPGLPPALLPRTASK